jgi:ATP-dependent Clp protease protease subunit
MRKDLMPQARNVERPQGLEWDIAPQARERGSPNLMAAAASDEASTISIFDQIGVDFWTGEGVTAKRISAALRSIGPENDVVVNINSPGGDLFEGLAIYSLFREHKGNVT